MEKIFDIFSYELPYGGKKRKRAKDPLTTAQKKVRKANKIARKNRKINKVK